MQVTGEAFTVRPALFALAGIALGMLFVI